MQSRIQNLFLMLALCAGTCQATAQGFVLSSTLGSGAYPFSICTADVNGDGRLDLICANYGDNTLTVLTNNGNGFFVSASTNSVGSNPFSVCAADVNGDGRADLICANYGDNTLTVLTNNGSGGFVFASTNSVGMTPHCVIAADVNGDGKLDLISANSGDNTLTVLTNDGSGGFVFAATLTVGANPWSVCAADVNGDGWVDLISANNGTNTLTVLTNDGGGGFAFASTLIVGNNPRSLCAADVNGDGKVDLISANFGGIGSLTALTNNGSGGFTVSGTYSLGGLPPGPWFVCAADVNGDGKMDLISTKEVAPMVVFTNNGSGGFVVSQTYGSYSGSPPFIPSSVCMADVNGDGKVDLLGADFNNLALIILTNNFAFPPPTSTPPVAITPTGNGLVVSWPSASAGWTLLQNPGLMASHWNPAGYNGYTVTDDGTNKSLFIARQPGNMFFRMMHP